jgi:rod shape-determining protein MreD
MKILKTILLIYLVALLSVTLLPKLTIFFALPHPILILALFFVFQKDFKKGLLWAVLGGLFLDFLGLKFPSNILITTAIVLLAWFLINKFFESSNIYLFLVFCFLGSLVYSFLSLPTLSLFHSFTFHLLNALYSTLFGLIIYLAYSKKLNINWQSP